MTGKQGLAFTLSGVDELTFFKILGDVTRDPVFARPLQVAVQEPRGGQPGKLTIAFEEGDRTAAVRAMQRLKTVLLRYGVQVDSVSPP